jgi:hypothetical protein
LTVNAARSGGSNLIFIFGFAYQTSPLLLIISIGGEVLAVAAAVVFSGATILVGFKNDGSSG